MGKKPTRQRFIDECTQRLLTNSVQGSELISEIKKKNYALTSVNNFMVDIKKAVRAQMQVDCSALEPFDGEAGVREFLDASVGEKEAIQQAHAAQPAWSEAAEAALSSIRFLPPSMDSFHFEKQDVIAQKQAQERKRTLKNRNPLVIHEAHGIELLRWAASVIESAIERSVPELTFALLLACGRRWCELLNKKSTFTAIDGEPFACMFLGQLKLKGNEQIGYKIPLLIESAAFLTGFHTLQSKLGDVPETNKEVNKRFEEKLLFWCKESVNEYEFFPRPNKVCKVTPHTFRAIYAAFGYHMFDREVTFCAWCQLVLGHHSLAESLDYSYILLKGFGDAGCLGRFEAEVTMEECSSGESEGEE